jgi:hypothetical protein
VRHTKSPGRAYVPDATVEQLRESSTESQCDVRFGKLCRRTRITAAVAEVTPEMLRSAWQEIDYRWEVCRITSVTHI